MMADGMAGKMVALRVGKWVVLTGPKKVAQKVVHLVGETAALKVEWLVLCMAA